MADTFDLGANFFLEEKLDAEDLMALPTQNNIAKVCIIKYGRAATLEL